MVGQFFHYRRRAFNIEVKGTLWPVSSYWFCPLSPGKSYLTPLLCEYLLLLEDRHKVYCCNHPNIREHQTEHPIPGTEPVFGQLAGCYNLWKSCAGSCCDSSLWLANAHLFRKGSPLSMLNLFQSCADMTAIILIKSFEYIKRVFKEVSLIITFSN